MAIFPTNHSPFYVSIYPLSPLFPPNSRNSTPLLASLTVLVFVFAYFFKTSPVALLHPFPLSASLLPQFFIANALSPRFPRAFSPTPISRIHETEEEGRGGWRGIENGRFHTRGGEGRTKETEHEGNGETKRLKGNRTSKRSTKRKKARKGERSLCVCVCGRAGQYSHRIENWARDNKPGLLFGTASFPFR